MDKTIAAALANWLPYKIVVADDVPHCQWLYTGDRPYTAPFFDDTVYECLSLPENSTQYKSLSSLDVLPTWAAQLPSVAPSAFVFHVSRCGSTLIAQLLGLRPQHIVLAEVPFFDALLRLPYQDKGVDPALASLFLPAVLQLYGQQRRGDETHLFIKADSWHLCFYRQLRQLYPAVPFILLYRSPDEVLQSQRRRQGMQAVPGVIEPALFGFDPKAIQQYTLDDYMAQVLDRYFTILLEVVQDDPHVLLLNYQEPVMQLMDKIAGLTDLHFTDEDRQQLQERSRFHAKYPGQVFQEPATTASLPDSLLPAMNLYRQLEEQRTRL